MAKKKSIAVGKTYVISTDKTDNPKLCAKVMNDGRESLYLDFYDGYRKEYDEETDTFKTKLYRRKESLKLYLWQAPRTTPERQQNEETLAVAKRIRFERGQELLQMEKGYRLQGRRETNFYDWYDRFVEKYTKSDKGKLRRAKEIFMECMAATPEYRQYAKTIKPEQLTKDMIVAFTEWLQEHFHGETPHTLYARFKKVIKAAVEKEILMRNPTTGVSIVIDKSTLKKDVLSQEEIGRLIATHYDKENPVIRHAFIFSLYTGVRFCDVKDLTFENVDYSNRLLKFEQNKTKGHSSASGVVLPLSDGLMALIGTPENGDRKSKIFPLPSHTMCNKALRHWTKRAGIDKHITWHCARHSLGTNLIANGENPIVVSKILGHTDLAMTQKYIRISDQLKRDALASLPELKL